jgi:uncharacterized protein (TIGR02594 family)
MAVYVVRPGDSLSGIAKRHDVSLQQVLKLNPQIKDPDVIHIGMSLNLPGDTPVPRANVVGGDAPWYQVALEELAHGVVEESGNADNPRIIEYHSTTTLKATNDETAWCSSFVNWCMIQARFKGTDSAGARSWLDWKDGKKLPAPRLGCVVVYKRGTQPWQGHVGFYADESDGFVQTLGGNQGNRVSIQAYRKDRVLGYRWPKSAS